MSDVLERVEALIGAPAAAPQDLARALAELGRVLDPEQSAPTPDTAQLFVRALELVARLKIESQDPALAECLLSIAKYAYVAGHPLKGLAPSQRAVELLRGLGSRALLRKALSFRGTLLADTGNLPGAIEDYAEALEIAVELHDPIAEAAVCNNLGVALIYAAQYGDSIACLERVVALSEGRAQLQRLRSSALGNIALACLHVEDFNRGLRAAKEAVELQDDPLSASARLSRVLAETHYTRLLLEVDAPQAARQRCEIAKRIAHESGLERAELYAGMAEGLCEVHSGMIDVGLSRLAKLLERARVLKGSLRDVLIAMVKANELAGRTDVALVYLRELMMHTKELQQSNALLHHRLHLEQLEQKQKQQPGPTPDTLMAQREVKLRGQLVEQVAHQELMKSRIEMLERLAVTAELRDDTTGEHSYRVGKLASLLAQEFGCDDDTVFMIDLAARLHDIGKIGIPDGILLKAERLNEAEMKLMQTHAMIGSEILAQSNVPHMKMAEEIARFHHEHWSGAGYPFGIGESAIPLAARITALADVFDALTHRRPYKEAWSVEAALDEIAKLKGVQFDPQLTDLFLALVPRLVREVGDLDEFLGQAARESRFIQARRKIAETLKLFNGNGSTAQRPY
ncbi:MAG TPA: HD domain-containing phosphohydrolase [Burkholderiaceae bacterium]|jgi:putative two-component system response regulator|nr:HD domain-containing phosphohydrolase [Burkholderiaceae bacterium]